MQYYYSLNGTDQLGPVSVDEFKALNLPPSTLVWRDGMAGWTPANQVPELASDASAARGLAPDTAPPAAPSPHAPINYQQPYANMQPNNGMAIASMVCGLVAIPMTCAIVPSLLAVIFGHVARAQIRRGQGGGDGMALTGLICGYVFTILGVGGWIIYIVIIIAAVGGAAAGGRLQPNPGPFPTTPGNVFPVPSPAAPGEG